MEKETTPEYYVSGKDGWYYEDWDEDKDTEPIWHYLLRKLFPKKVYFHEHTFKVLDHRGCDIGGNCTHIKNGGICHGRIKVIGKIPPYDYDRTTWVCQVHDTIREENK